MIDAISLSSVADRRFVGTIFNGSQYARTDFLGSDQSDRDTPQALLVEQMPASHIPPHFHGIDQFQVVVDGRGMLGKHAVQAVCVHFSQAYTGYGPITAPDDTSLFYFTLRAQSEPGAFFLPEPRDKQKPGKKRNLTVDVSVRGAPTDAGVALDAVIEPEDGGLGAWHLRLGGGDPFEGPDPMTGGGQYYIVLDGELCYGGSRLEKWSCLFVTPPESAPSVTAGGRGAEVLILQFPFWEGGTAQNVPAF